MSIDDSYQKAMAAAQADFEKKIAHENERIAEMVARIEELAPILKQHPHPADWRAEKGDSFYDYAKYILGSGRLNKKKRDVMLEARFTAGLNPPADFAKLSKKMASAPIIGFGDVVHEAGPCKIVGAGERRIALHGPYKREVVEEARRLGGSWNGLNWVFSTMHLAEVKKLCELYGVKPSIPEPKPLKMVKPTDEQLRVLGKLIEMDQPIVYFKGGFWSTPDPLLKGGDFLSREGGWWTGKRTVFAMENRGWLKQLPHGTNYPVDRFPDLADRVVTDGGRQIYEKFQRR